MKKDNGRITPTFSSDEGDVTDFDEDEDKQQISIGLSPMGGIGLNVTDKSGTTAGALISIEEAEQLAGRLQSLATILLHMGYIETAQQQLEAQKLAKKLHLPGV